MNIDTDPEAEDTGATDATPDVRPQPGPPTAPSAAAPELRTVEAWAAARQTPAWLLAATRHARRWPVGQELTAADFDQAVHAAAHQEIR